MSGSEVIHTIVADCDTRAAMSYHCEPVQDTYSLAEAFARHRHASTEALRAERDALREALEPFAKLADEMDALSHSILGVGLMGTLGPIHVGGAGSTAGISNEALEAARAALLKAEGR